MPNQVLEILIKVRDDATRGFDNLKTKVKGLFGGFTELKSAMDLSGVAMDRIGQAIEETVGKTVAYATEVRNLSTMTGMSAEETSRLIQVASDWGITAQQLQTALGMMAKNGIEPSIEALADIADEFASNTDSADRAQKMTELFGRQWQTLIPLLKDGGDALRDQAEAIDEGLVLTEQQIQAARDYEVALDNLNDVIDAQKIKLGNELIPLMAQILTPTVREVINGQVYLVKTIGDTTIAYQEFGGTMAVVTEKYWAAKTASDGYAGSVDLARFRTLEYAEAQRQAATATDDTSASETRAKTVYDAAAASIRSSNTELATRIALQDALALATGQTTQEELSLKRAVEVLTAQVTSGKITQQQYIELLGKLASGAIDSKNAVRSLWAAIEALKDKTITITTHYKRKYSGEIGPESDTDNPSGGRRASGGPSGPAPIWTGEFGPEPFFPAQQGQMLSNRQAMEALSGQGRGVGTVIGPIYISQEIYATPGMDELAVAQLAAEQMAAAISESARAAANGGLRYAG